MVNSEENMTNLKDTKTRVTVGDSRKFTRKKRGDWHGWKKRDLKPHRVTLKNTAVITGLHANTPSVTRSLQKGFQVTSEGETLIIKKNSTEISFDEKMVDKYGK